MIDVLRQPPHAIDAEQNVLGGLMIANESFVQIADWVSEEDFYKHEHRVIWRAIAEHAGRGAAFDVVTLADWFQRNGEDFSLAYLYELQRETASAANITAHAEIVVEKARLRKLIEIGTRMTGGAFEARSAARDISAQVTHDLAKIATVERGGLVSAKAGLRDLFNTMSERYGQPRRLLGLPTPWREVNEWTRGLQRKKLYIVAARPSMGKSIFGGQLAAMNALRGANVAWFSVEMTAAECMERAVSALSDVDYDWVQEPNKEDTDCEVHWNAVSQAMERLLAAPLLIDDTPGLSRAQFLARARRAHLQRKLDLIVLDHIHDMEVDPKQKVHDYGQIAQAGKTLAKEMDCPVVMLAQLNRALETRANKRPVMSDLRESGEIEQKGDVIIFLHRDDYYEPSKHTGIVEAICAKGRGLKRHDPILLKNRFDRARLEDYHGKTVKEDDAVDAAVSRWSRRANKAAA